MALFNLKHFFKTKDRIPPKEAWRNLWNLIKMEYYNWKKIKGEDLLPPGGYEASFIDLFDEGELNTDDWRYAIGWGNFHSRYLHQYYDYDGTLSYVKNGELVLDLKHIPKHYIKSELPKWQQSDILPNEFTIPTGIGYVSTRKAYKYGWFEAKVKLPVGDNFWSAFWLHGDPTWPPEIDIFEAYSNVSNEYSNDLMFGLFKKKRRKIQPNLHVGIQDKETGEGVISYGSYDVPVFNMTDEYVQYVCHWEEDFIKIYYNGHLVLECTDPVRMEWYNKVANGMIIILGNGSMKNGKKATESPVLVKSVRVYQKKNN